VNKQKIQETFKLSWHNHSPQCKKKIVVLIPFYNEYKSPDFDKRIKFFHCLAKECPPLMDVVLIDDGSNDQSLKMIKEFKEKSNSLFFLASVTPNSAKVGALYLLSMKVQAEYIVLTDFDTQLKNLQKIGTTLSLIDKDQNLMGCYFKMIPTGKKGLLLYFQMFEYAFVRMKYKSHENPKSISIMPGAGCCYRRSYLLKIYSLHSGLRNGEDREATVIGQKLGYKSIYADQVQALTSSPQTIKSFFNQRRLWKVGFIQTILRRRSYYLKALLKGEKAGIQNLKDILRNFVIFMFPFEIFLFSLSSTKAVVFFIIGSYSIVFVRYLSAFIIHKSERSELVGQGYLLIFYPMYLFIVSFLPLWSSFFKLIRQAHKELLAK
jgi:cellulose synthase/poly-beta-1,6-N-acetylglucosamine synthase-like glycosyltransferase